MKVMLGHDGPPQGLWRENLVDGRPLQLCPLRLLQRAEVEAPRVLAEMRRHVIEIYPLYKQGFLLVSGGVVNQPAITMDYMRAIDQLKAAQDAKQDAIANKPLDGSPTGDE